MTELTDDINKQEINRACAELLYPDADHYMDSSFEENEAIAIKTNGVPLGERGFDFDIFKAVNIYTNREQRDSVFDAILNRAGVHLMADIIPDILKVGIDQALIKFIEANI